MTPYAEEGLVCLSTDFKIPATDAFLDDGTLNPQGFLKTAPTVVQVQGQPQVQRDYPFWQTYVGPEGSVGFFKNLWSIHPDFCGAIVRDIVELFRHRVAVDRTRVIIIRTQGRVPIHTDENSRNAAVNIGWYNSSVANTLIASAPMAPPYDGFADTHVSYAVQDNHAYLIDTQRPHSVAGPPDVERYLITYGFVSPFKDILALRN